MEIKKINYMYNPLTPSQKKYNQPDFQALIIKDVPITPLRKALRKNPAITELAEKYNVIVKSFRNKSSVVPENYKKIDIPPSYDKDYYLYGIKFDIKDGKQRIGSGGLYFASEYNKISEYVSNNHLRKEIENLKADNFSHMINLAR